MPGSLSLYAPGKEMAWLYLGMHAVPYYGYVRSMRRVLDGDGTSVHHPSNCIRGPPHGDGAGLKTDVLR
jgi:hypothetical protein